MPTGGFVFVGRPCRSGHGCCFLKGSVDVTRDVERKVGISGGIKVQSRRLALQASMKGHRSCIVPRVGMNTNYDVMHHRISYIGGSDTVFHKGTESEIQCMTRCSKNAACGGFTFLPHSGTCYLKTPPLMFIADAGALSAQTLPRNNATLENTCHLFDDSTNSCLRPDRIGLSEELRCCQKPGNNVGFCYIDRGYGPLPPLECPFDFEGDDMPLGGKLSNLRRPLHDMFVDGHCFVPYPNATLYSDKSINNPGRDNITEVECMVEVLNEKNAGGYQFFPPGGCPMSRGRYILGIQDEPCCLLIGAIRIVGNSLPPPGLRTDELAFRGDYINSGLRVKLFSPMVQHCYVPMPFVDINWQNGRRGVTGPGGSDIAVHRNTNEGSCMRKCSKNAMCIVATFVFPDICVLKAGPVFFFTNHDTGPAPYAGSPAVASMMKVTTSGQAPEAPCSDDNVCSQLKSDGLFYDATPSTKFICCKKQRSNLGLCKKSDDCSFRR
eukprot:TRINITY_DN7093_c0_g4_i1.p1 TRINITY_DN7093_c0_g4~~TRINITY_DN7093_c0_g4_i1.p1  ORF type:complete len:494 (-),score=20.23 TRINITY_DN7093_c0_g4_i1:172-1653(-)